MLRSNEIWREVERETGEKLRVVTGGLIISGPSRSATTHVANFFGNTLAAARRFGIEHEILDAPGIRKRFPQFAVRDNEVGYFEPGAGYLRPERCIAAHLKLAASSGAELHMDERVQAIDDRAGHVRITTDRGTYDAKSAILSMGAWLPGFIEPALARRLTVTRQVLYWFAPHGDAGEFEAPRFPIWIWELQETKHVIYGFPAIDGAGGGVKVATEQYLRTTTPGSVIAKWATRRSAHASRAGGAIPSRPFRPMRKSVTCMYTATPDFQFWIDRHPVHAERRDRVGLLGAWVQALAGDWREGRRDGFSDGLRAAKGRDIPAGGTVAASTHEEHRHDTQRRPHRIRRHRHRRRRRDLARDGYVPPGFALVRPERALRVGSVPLERRPGRR